MAAASACSCIEIGSAQIISAPVAACDSSHQARFWCVMNGARLSRASKSRYKLGSQVRAMSWLILWVRFAATMHHMLQRALELTRRAARELSAFP